MAKARRPPASLATFLERKGTTIGRSAALPAEWSPTLGYASTSADCARIIRIGPNAGGPAIDSSFEIVTASRELPPRDPPPNRPEGKPHEAHPNPSSLRPRRCHHPGGHPVSLEHGPAERASPHPHAAGTAGALPDRSRPGGIPGAPRLRGSSRRPRRHEPDDAHHWPQRAGREWPGDHGNDQWPGERDRGLLGARQSARRQPHGIPQLRRRAPFELLASRRPRRRPGQHDPGRLRVHLRGAERDRERLLLVRDRRGSRHRLGPQRLGRRRQVERRHR